MSFPLNRHWVSRFIVFRPAVVAVAVFLGCGVLATAPAWAQGKKAAEKKSSDEDEIPPAEEVALTTDDGLEMAATYFPGTKGSESIPVILLHGLKGSRKDFTQEQGLASFLQEKLGCAVIAPDLRGHGDSTKIKSGAKSTTVKAEKLKLGDFAAMVTQDMRAVKDFLWKKNNEKALNLNKLVVIGVDLGASLALNYAAYDATGYEQGRVAYGPLKLGMFVKGVVLISPEANHPGLNTLKVMSVPYIRNDLPVMLTAGKKSAKQWGDTEKLHSIFEKRPLPPDSKPESITLWYANKLDTSLQGAKLLAEPSMGVPDKIVKFMKARLVTNPEAKSYSWKELKRPHE